MLSDELTAAVATVKQRAQALNACLRALVQTIKAVDHDDPEFVQEMRHYGIMAEFEKIAESIGDFDTAVAAVIRRIGYD